MLKKIKTYLLEEKLSKIKANDLPHFLNGNFNNEDLLYENFIKFLNIENKKMTSKGAKLFIWFKLLTKEKQIEFLETNKDFYFNPNFVREFFKQEDNIDIKAKILKNHIKQKKTVLNTIKEIVPQRTGVFSDFFDMDAEFLRVLKHPKIREDIKSKGDDYLRFLLDMKAVDKTMLVWDFNYYNGFVNIFENAKNINISSSDFLTGMMCVKFRLNAKDKKFEKLLNYLVVEDNPEELTKVRNLFSSDVELQVLYESLCLKKMIDKNPNIEESNNKRKRL